MQKIALPKRKLAPLITLSDVVPREMKWLWYPYIPAEAATLMYGPGGVGKTHISCAIASAISRGDPLPGQSKRRTPGNVLMLSAEDDLEVVLQPRFAKMNADMSKIKVSPNTFILDRQGLKDVEEYIRASTAVVCFIDPIVAWVGGKIDMNRSNDVRAMIGPLHTMAQQTGTAVVIVGHSRKGREGADYEAAMGSSDFVNAVRSSLFITRTNDGTKIMKHVKSNYAKEGPAISFSFDESQFVWGEPLDDDDIVHSGGLSSAKPKNQAKAWLTTTLKDGPMPSKTIDMLAGEAGIAPATLNRAKVGVAESFVRRVDGKMTWFWRLIGDNRKETSNGDSSKIHGVESGGRAEIQDRRNRAFDALELQPSSGDSGSDGEVGEDRSPETEAASGDSGRAGKGKHALGGQLHTRGRLAEVEAEEETEEQAMMRRTQEARARARAFLEERGIG